jgi:hypothetical protein
MEAHKTSLPAQEQVSFLPFWPFLLFLLLFRHPVSSVIENQQVPFLVVFVLEFVYLVEEKTVWLLARKVDRLDFELVLIVQYVEEPFSLRSECWLCFFPANQQHVDILIHRQTFKVKICLDLIPEMGRGPATLRPGVSHSLSNRTFSRLGAATLAV